MAALDEGDQGSKQAAAHANEAHHRQQNGNECRSLLEQRERQERERELIMWMVANRILSSLSKQKKNVFPTNHRLHQAEFIAHNVKSDLKLKNRLIGTIIGHFTTDEFAFFVENEAELLRRMTDLLVQRLQSTIES